jgi:DNA-binding MarR family transcriptional regulator
MVLRWTEEEDNNLRKSYGIDTVTVIAKRLGRTSRAVRDRARRLGVAGSRKHRRHGLTELQRDVLEIMAVGKRLGRAHLGLLPSVREMTDWLGFEQPSFVAEAMKGLEQKGYIQRSGRQGRSYEVLRVLDGGLVP